MPPALATKVCAVTADRGAGVGVAVKSASMHTSLMVRPTACCTRNVAEYHRAPPSSGWACVSIHCASVPLFWAPLLRMTGAGGVAVRAGVAVTIVRRAAPARAAAMTAASRLRNSGSTAQSLPCSMVGRS